MSARSAARGGSRVTAGASAMPDGRPLPRGALVIARADWERMKRRPAPASSSANCAGEVPSRAEDEARRRELSQAHTAGWGNTIKGMRAKRLQAKAIRDAEYEQLRLAQDKEEEQREAELRQAAIERARALQMMVRAAVDSSLTPPTRPPRTYPPPAHLYSSPTTHTSPGSLCRCF